MAGHQKINKGFGAMPVKRLSFIKDLIINCFAKDAGLSSGFKKAIQSVAFLNFPGTVHLKSNKSRITGLSNCQSGALTYLKSATFSMMVLYFGRNNCFISIMNAQDQSIAEHIHTAKEGYHHVIAWFRELRAKGLNPLSVTIDGEHSVMRAIREVWPKAKLQRCLYHIQREGMRWLRTFPKTQAGRELRAILSALASVKSFKDRDVFMGLFHAWINAHYSFIKALPNSTIQFKDLKKTVTLIKNALPDMFHYLENPNIPSTTNALEGFYSRLKSDYQRHRGLSSKNRINYLNWYCWLKNSTNF